MKPKVSCICVTYNRYDRLRNTIQSFMKQTYTRKELVIVDDSTTVLPEDLKDTMDSYPGLIRYIKLKRRRTIGYKRNKAISSSTGSHIAVWDDDDIHFPSRLEAQIKSLRRGKYEMVMLSHTTLYSFPDRNALDRIPRHVHDRWWYRGWMCPSMVFTKKIWSNVGMFRPIHVHEDYHFIRKVEQTTTIGICKGDFFAYTVHPGGVSSMHAYLTSCGVPNILHGRTAHN